MAFLGELGQYMMVGGRLVRIPVAAPVSRAAAPVYRAPAYVVPQYVPRGRVAPSLRVRYGR